MPLTPSVTSPGAFVGRLDWEKIGNSAMVSHLGDFPGGDGVRFVSQFFPTCHRRGKWRLTVEVAGGPGHELWGCFDDQDQPVRNYHSPETMFLEAEAIAEVLWQERAASSHELRASSFEPASRETPKLYFACAQHVRSCEACGEESFDPFATTAQVQGELQRARTQEHDLRNDLTGLRIATDILVKIFDVPFPDLIRTATALVDDREALYSRLTSIEEAWKTFWSENDLEDHQLLSFRALSAAIEPSLVDGRRSVRDLSPPMTPGRGSQVGGEFTETADRRPLTEDPSP